MFSCLVRHTLFILYTTGKEKKTGADPFSKLIFLDQCSLFGLKSVHDTNNFIFNSLIGFLT